MELITGEKPFGNISIYEYTRKILDGERPKFSKTINKKIKDLISRCCSEERENRTSFDEVFQVLSENVSYSTNETFFKDDIREYIDILNEEKDISLEKEAFMYSLIESISFPPELVQIGEKSFFNCSHLQIVEIVENSKLREINPDIFDSNHSIIFMVPTKITILIKNYI